MADPWVKFYTTDWRSDPALRMCGLSARGLWIEMICIMHEAHPYGHLLVNGSPVTDTQLGALVGAPCGQVAALLGELEQHGVFSRTRAGVIYSRKMTKMAKKAATARNNGRKGGNPSLSKQKGNPAWDNPTLKGQVKPQKPEARSQSKKEPKGSKKATRLSDDWIMPADWRTWASSEGLSRDRINFEAAQFKDYWLSVGGQKGAKLDWLATWRTWVRRSLQNNPTQHKAGKVVNFDAMVPKWD